MLTVKIRTAISLYNNNTELKYNNPSLNKWRCMYRTTYHVNISKNIQLQSTGISNHWWLSHYRNEWANTSLHQFLLSTGTWEAISSCDHSLCLHHLTMRCWRCWNSSGSLVMFLNLALQDDVKRRLMRLVVYADCGSNHRFQLAEQLINKHHSTQLTQTQIHNDKEWQIVKCKLNSNSERRKHFSHLTINATVITVTNFSFCNSPFQQAPQGYAGSHKCTEIPQEIDANKYGKINN